jgi:tripartite-type tricarboxylate transporter receptor subunit TctC
MRDFARRTLFASAIAVAGAALFWSPTSALAAYPERPVTIIVAWTAGGATDLVARSIQPELSKKLGAELIIKNIAGASGTIGTAEAARAKPDGYTILITPTGPMTTQPHLRKIPYGLDSFAPVGRIAVAPVMMMVPKTSKLQTLNDVIETAKANPGKLKFASSGAGTLPHIAILALNKAAGIDTKHIPYKGSANAMKALLGGEVDVFSDMAQLVPKYDVHPVISWTKARNPEFPNVASMKEGGFDFEMINWVGMYAPKATPDDVVAKLAEALEAAIQEPSVKEALEKLRVKPGHLGPVEFGKFAAGDSDRNRELLAEAGLLAK